MKLSSKQKKYLKGEAHHLPVLVHIGKNGCSESLIKQVNSSLKHHELIKVRIAAENQDDFQGVVSELESKAGGTLVHSVGHTVIFFKQTDKDSNYELPNK